jgi:hypothetical protein
MDRLNDDSALYTGVDATGVFGNEVLDESTKEIIDEQKKQLAELTPKLQDIITMLDAERDMVLDFISGYVDATTDDDDLFRAELKAAGRYRKYLEGLKTKFRLALDEAKK